MDKEILQPVVALAAWSIVMLLWTVATRLPAMKAAGINLGKMVGGKGSDADGVLPAKAQWKAHNYNHLMEQPTLFYAVCLALAVAGAGYGINAGLAWAYTGLRILHSLVQATSNIVRWRFLLFLLSTLVLVALIIRAAGVVF